MGKKGDKNRKNRNKRKRKKKMICKVPHSNFHSYCVPNFMVLPPFTVHFHGRWQRQQQKSTVLSSSSPSSGEREIVCSPVRNGIAFMTWSEIKIKPFLRSSATKTICMELLLLLLLSLLLMLHKNPMPWGWIWRKKSIYRQCVEEFIGL